MPYTPPTWYVGSIYWDYYNEIPKRNPNAPWAPPWMRGELGEPNKAKEHVPHYPVKLRSEGIVAGEIIAWRAWYWDKKVGKLRSIFVNYHWPLDAPAVGKPAIGYGIHAFTTANGAWKEYVSCKDDVIFGLVALWGDVVQYQYGYCAEFGRVHSIIGKKHDAIRRLYKARAGSWEDQF